MGRPRRQIAIAAGAGLLALYLAWLRPWQLRWGATSEEVARAMPCDEVVERPTFDATRAVTVHAAPAAVWPWLVQMGIRRAGWYSYDWVDNLGRRSAERILPEFQGLAIGDLIPMSPDGRMGLWLKAWQPPSWMVWWDKKGTTTWVWGLYPQADGTTRLITRVRMRYEWTSPVILFDLLLDVGDIVMMRKCLLGIKRRVERTDERVDAGADGRAQL